MFGPSGSTPEYGYSGYWNVPVISTRIVAGEDVLGAVAVMHVEIDDGGTRARPWCSSACATPTATLLNRQKPIARSRVGVMAGRAHGAERRVALAADDEIGREHQRPGAHAARPSSESGLSAVSGIEVMHAAVGARLLDLVDVVRSMYTRELLARRAPARDDARSAHRVPS